MELPLQAYFRINAENMGQFERTLIIVDEDAYVHYVEGCTAPIYSTDSLHSAVVEIHVAARRPLPLHDHPELVDQRLQPGHQAGGRRGGRHHGVGRRQPRLAADHEVPGRDPEGRAGSRRGAVDRVRGQGPAPGRRRQDHPCGAPHHLGDHLQVDLQGRRSLLLPRPAAGEQGRRRVALQGRLRRADHRRGEPHGHLPVHQHRRERRRDRPRGDGLEDRRGAALLPDEPRPLARRRPRR